MSTKPEPSIGLDRLALNLMTAGTKHRFEALLDACVRHGIGFVSPWQEHYAEIGPVLAARRLSERGLSVNTICRMSGFGPADTKAAWQQALDDANRLIEEASVLGAASITVVGGGCGLGGDLVGARRRILEGVAQVLPHARAAGVTLALEPLHPMVAADRGAINTLGQATEYVRQLGDGAALMVDAYNAWWDPGLAEAITNARGLIGGYQVSDWLNPTNDLAFDRGMPGDGVIDLAGVRRMLEAADYEGLVEMEILSAYWSSQPLDKLFPVVIRRFLAFC